MTDSDKMVRPLISFCLATYNHERYVAEAIAGALAQIYSPLEIIISDDCSTDRTFEIIQEMVSVYNGTHQIIVNRNERNLGMIGNFNKKFELAHGEIILNVDGDDISVPERAEWSWEILRDHPEMMAVCFQMTPIDTDSKEIRYSPFLEFFRRRRRRRQRPLIVHDITDAISHQCGILNGATRAYRREMMEFFGPISEDSPGDDGIMYNRAILLGKHGMSNKNAALIRSGNISLTSGYQRHSLADHCRMKLPLLPDAAMALKQEVISSENFVRYVKKVYNEIKYASLFFHGGGNCYTPKYGFRLFFRVVFSSVPIRLKCRYVANHMEHAVRRLLTKTTQKK